MKGLEKYGRRWSLVAGVVRTRTSTQCRSHAQKYFDKISISNEAKVGLAVCKSAKRFRVSLEMTNGTAVRYTHRLDLMAIRCSQRVEHATVQQYS